jgi:hypothetical protein
VVVGQGVCVWVSPYECMMAIGDGWGWLGMVGVVGGAEVERLFELRTVLMLLCNKILRADSSLARRAKSVSDT